MKAVLETQLEIEIHSNWRGGSKDCAGRQLLELKAGCRIASTCGPHHF